MQRHWRVIPPLAHTTLLIARALGYEQPAPAVEQTDQDLATQDYAPVNALPADEYDAVMRAKGLLPPEETTQQ